MAAAASPWDLAGRTCLVTGGTSGLGRALALGLADAGARVTVASSNPDKVRAAAEELGPDHAGVTLDVTDEEGVRRVVREVAERDGRLDAVVNAAGVTQRVAFEDTELADWERVVRVHLTGSFLVCREAGRVMLAQDPRPSGERGSLLLFASIQSFLPFEGTVAYAAAKTGVAGLARSLANDWSGRGVRVNALAPGVFPTELNRALIEGTERGERILAHTPMGRFGEHHELVGAALYLLGDGASFTTGVVLPVDGGFLARGVG
jgi:NAD(P)-dependent dehydrogenase (short-subunit alcohol dehydrogenase family)